ncbi:MAG TPA: M14 family zinc carboxypeptidase [Gemmatimonadales bacterium]|nr:M14 family zinc carboxypeptidase [Gemmatimonadales bacterium]
MRALVVLLSLTATLQGQQAPPSPESVLGFKPGADFRLATYEESVRYFQALDAASDRIRLVEVGRTSEGRAWQLALISASENLANLERYREMAQRLAHPSGLTDDEARRLARQGKALVDISGGLHASEAAGAQHTIQLAHDLVAASDSLTRAWLNDVIVFLWPSLNPDGQNIVVNWYRENVGGPYEGAPLHELYQKYIGHDNNRDAYMLNVTESRVITRAWRHWEPQIIYVHHQSSPFPTRIWVPPFAEPIAPRTPPIMLRQVNAIGMLIGQALESRGQVGTTHAGTGFDAWYPGYIDYLPMMQNIAAWWTETALYRYATPYFYTITDFPPSMRDLRAGALYGSPWKGGWWRLGDAVAYMLTASKATVDYAHKFKEDLLYNRYQSGRDAIRRYQSEPPYAYLVPQSQRDPVAAAELLRRLAFNGVRVHQLAQDATHEGVTYPRGTWVIPMDQEFAELVRQLFDVQVYPDLREYPDGPPEQPYDAAGWTLPYQMGVQVVTALSPLTAEFRAAARLLERDPGPARDAPEAPFESNPVAGAIVPPPGRITGPGPRLAVDPAQNNAFRLINRALAAGGQVRFLAGSAGTDGAPGTSGRYVVDGVAAATLERWVGELTVQAQRTAEAGSVPVRARVALYKPWRASMDEGWTRWLLDQYGFTYTTITNGDFAAGRLGDRFDVIMLASDPPSLLLNGYARGSVPPRYEGGIGDAGVRELDAFVRAGGTLVCLNQSSDLAIEQLHLPVKNLVKGMDRKEFFASGSILEVITDPAHQVMAGMPDRAKVFFDDGPVFTTLEGFQGDTLARYATQGSPLASGYLLGEKHLQGNAAALEVRHGAGRVVLIGFRPQWRGQPFGTFWVVFNAALGGGR